MTHATRAVPTRRRAARWIAALACAAAAFSAAAREPYQGVSVVVVQRVAGGGSGTRLDDAAQVKSIVDEVNAERGKLWNAWRGKLGPCAVRIVFGDGERRVGRLVLDGNQLIELAGASESTGMARELMRFDLGNVRRAAARVQGSGCGH